MRRGFATAAAAALSAALLLAGCGVFVAPQPTPGAMTDVINALVLRGATVSDQVAGDAGCGDKSLFGNAVRLDLRMPTDAAAGPVYLFRWKNKPTYDASAAPFGACRDAFSNAHPDSTVSFVEAAPWRAYGPDWSPALEAAVKEALEAAAGL